MLAHRPPGNAETRRHSGAAVAALVGVIAACGCLSGSSDKGATPASRPAEASAAQVHEFCGACHGYPPPDSFPRSSWRKEVEQGYQFFKSSRLALDPPALESVVGYYEDRAPEALPPLEQAEAASPPPVQFTCSSFGTAHADTAPAVSNVNLVHLFDKRRLDVLVCDMARGQVLVLKPYDPSPALRVLAEVPHPAHAEVVDLDGDDIPDILVANLGNFYPTDNKVGSVVWLRGQPDGTFTPIPVLEGVGRVADVQAADFRGVGKLDLVVAVFGWRTTGEIVYLENQTTDWSHPKFVPHVLDERHGAIHVPVADLNGDGKPDFVALISQEHETIVAFLNDGGGKFRMETIYAAPHPAWGSSGIQLVDLDGDGDLDVLYTNGDSMDSQGLLKPYHGIQWLENRRKFPFAAHHLTSMYGVHRAVAADLRGTGRLDIIAVSLLPSDQFPERKQLGLDSVVLLEQTAPGKFVRHALEQGSCDHVTCIAGDVYGDGRTHLVTGNFFFGSKRPQADSITLWKNEGPQTP
jgi:hypothetical protein